MGMKRVRRRLLVAAVVVVALVAAVAGFQSWSAANQRARTAAAFAVLDTADRRIDLRHVFPDAKRSESGVEVRLLGEGPGPVVSYSFSASSTPDWKTRLNQAMERAGYGSDGEPWIFPIRGWSVLVMTAGGDDEDSGRVYVTISVH
jgi:hypothetical protein